MKPKDRKEKSLVYVRLVEAMEQSGCALCRVINEGVRKYLDRLLQEHVNDPLIRKKLRKSLGFCKTHARHLLSMNDPLGVAIIYSDLIETLEDKVSQETFGSLEPGVSCPLCADRDEQERSFISELVSYMRDPEFQHAIIRSEGFCIPHAQLILRELDGAGRDSFIQQVRTHVAQLKHELGQLMRKNDYRCAHESLTVKEKTSWQRAVEFVVGGCTNQ